MNARAFISILILSAACLAGASPATSRSSNEHWHYQDWSWRLPLHVTTAQPHAIEGQNVLLETIIDTAAYAGLIRNDLGDLRFTWLDPSTGSEVPLRHFIPEAGRSAVTNVTVAGDVRIRRGTGVTDSVFRYPTHHRNNPGNYYHDGKLYMSYVARGTDQNHVDLLVYDTAGRTFEGPIRIADLFKNPREEENEHRAPALLVDHDGHLHIIYGAHGGSMYLQHRRTVNPGDVSAFTPANVISTAPHAYGSILQLANGDIYVFTRESISFSPADFAISYHKSTDGGLTWGNTVRTIHSNNHVAYYSDAVVGRDGNTIHLVWEWFDYDLQGADRYRDVLYAYSDDGGETWKRADGTNLGPTPSRLGSDLDYIHVGTNKWTHGLDLDSNNNPHILYGDVSAPTKLYHARWDGGQWIKNQIGTDNFYLGDIKLYPDDEIRVVANNRISNIGASTLRSFDLGETWERTFTRLRNGPRLSVPEMPAPSGASPIMATWSDGNFFGDYGPLFMFPESHEHSQATIYMYHGNPDATRTDEASLADLKDLVVDFRDHGPDLPPGWETVELGNGVVTVDPDAGVHLNNPDDTQGGRAATLREFVDAPLAHGTYRARVRFDDTSSTRYLATMRNEDSEDFNLLVAHSDGTWKYQAGGFNDFPEPRGYQAGVFHEIEIHWDARRRLYRVSVDGHSLTTDFGIPIPTSSMAAFNRLVIRTIIGSASSFTVRDVEIYGSPFRRDYWLDAGFPEERHVLPGNRFEGWTLE